jgi:hypothetical protein
MPRLCSRCRISGHFIDRCPTIIAELDMISNMQQTLPPGELAMNLRALSSSLLERYVRLNYGLHSIVLTSGGKPGLIEVIVSHSPGNDGGRGSGGGSRVTVVNHTPSVPAILNNDCVLLDDLYEHIGNEHVRELFQRIYRNIIPTVETMDLQPIPFDERIPIVKAVEATQFNEDIPLATTVILF